MHFGQNLGPKMVTYLRDQGHEKAMKTIGVGAFWLSLGAISGTQNGVEMDPELDPQIGYLLGPLMTLMLVDH